MGRSRAAALFVGGSWSYTKRWIFIATGLLILSTGYTLNTGTFIEPLFYPPGAIAAKPAMGLVFLLIWIGLTAWPAYQNEGLLGSWAVMFGPIAGALTWNWIIRGISGGGPLTDAALAALAAAMLALTIGTVGFLVGVALRRNTTRQIQIQYLNNAPRGRHAASYLTALIGQNRTRSAIGLVGAVLLAGVVLGVSVGLNQVVDGLWGARWWIAPIVLPFVAGAYAYWNDGLLVSVWFSATTAFAMYWGFINTPPLTGHLVLLGLSVTTVLTALPYGILGYVVGRFTRMYKARDTVEEPSTEWLFDLLIGRVKKRSALALALAAGLFVAGFALILFLHEPGDPAALQRQRAIRDYFRLVDLLSLRTEWRFVALLAWIVLPAGLASWNDGYLISWALAFGAAYGVNVGNRFSQDPDVVQAFSVPMFQVLIHALVLGTIGFVLGAGLRRAYRGVRIEYSDPKQLGTRVNDEP